MTEKEKEKKDWDTFLEYASSVDTGSAHKSKWWFRLERLAKAVSYVVTFVVVFGCSIVSKGTTLFMIKQLSKEPSNIAFCNHGPRGNPFIPNNDTEMQFEVDFTCDQLDDMEQCQEDRIVERVAWIWALAFVYSLPQVAGFLRSVTRWMFKFTSWPHISYFMFVLLMELLHTVGLAMLAFMVLPHLDSVNALLLTSSLAVLPAFMLLLSRFQQTKTSGSGSKGGKFMLFFRGLQPDNLKTEVKGGNENPYKVEDENYVMNPEYAATPAENTKEVEESGLSRLLCNLSILIDVLSLAAQLSGALMWCLFQYFDFNQDYTKPHPYPWAVPVAVILASFGWWENFTEEDSWTSLGKFLWKVKNEMYSKTVVKKRNDDQVPEGKQLGMFEKFKNKFSGSKKADVEEVETYGTRHRVYTFVIPLKLAIFYGCMVLISWWTELVDNPSQLVDFFTRSFGTHTYRVSSLQLDEIGGGAEYGDGLSSRLFFTLNDDSQHPVWILLVQMISSFLTYFAVRFASQVWIQSFSFAFPISLSLPCSLVFLVSMCGARSSDICAFQDTAINIPNRLFFECPDTGDIFNYIWDNNSWLALAWFLSYLWINVHIWFPKSPRLATSEQIFCTPYYDGLFIDQSLVMNRRAEQTQADSSEHAEEEEDYGYSKGNYRPSSNSSRGSGDKKVKAKRKIYACATMWHETEDEMMEMLKSLFRIDNDWATRTNIQETCEKEGLKVPDPDYYDWETHIFFDNCFNEDKSLEDEDYREKNHVLNDYARQLITLMNKALNKHYKTSDPLRLDYPVRYPTPYGGQLVWTLPGQTKIVCHLKDQRKIRIKKRWSQIMYMYYLLGYKIREQKKAYPAAKKMEIAENTFLLALDGDIDFQPNAVLRLVDLMTKNKGVGAACGRIHPTGSGYMPAYQKFEYAVGHWLQKATEHVLGCVLCSPGCFSLFRGSALMDDNVMRKYATEPSKPRHHIQFDQGEDRWLCTLLLQQGWRVEYSAASDSYTACPETFDEFYNQRRRWMPSTMLNILDLLENWKLVTEQNEDISKLYILYQTAIMIGTFIGPGGIYMMISGSMTIVFGFTALESLAYNLIPLLMFCLACYYTDSKVQLALAKVLTLVYSMVMLAVYVGLIIQIANEAFSAMSFFFPLLLAGMLHIEEAYCMIYMMVYLITIPSMYILLVIYSLFNLWNTGWGTREKKADEKSSAKQKREAEEDAKLLAEIEKEDAKNKKAGIGEVLVGWGSNLGGKAGGGGGSGGGGGEKGSVDFSCGNILRCLCFTHDDPHDPSKHLQKIEGHMQEVNNRLEKIERASGVGLMSSRRRSSTTMRSNSLRRMSGVKEEAENGVEVDTFVEDVQEEEEVYDVVEEKNVIHHDDLANPYWIDDGIFKDDGTRAGTEKDNGYVGHLPSEEIDFWKELIRKYLTPFKEKHSKREFKKIAVETSRELFEYRDSFIFGFLMINSFYVVLITMLQVQTPLKIPWTLLSAFNLNGLDGLVYSFEYKPPDNNESPQIMIMRETAMLDVLGLVFLLTFSSITFAQVFGMLLHRWQTFCHYVAFTHLEFFEKATSGDASGALLRDLMKKTRQYQEPDKEEKTTDRLEKRRMTIARLETNDTKKGDDQVLNLRKNYKVRFDKDPNARRDTMAIIERRSSVAVGSILRRSSLAPPNSMSRDTSFSTSSSGRGSLAGQIYTNRGYDNDDGDDFVGRRGSRTSGVWFDQSIVEPVSRESSL